MTQNYIAGLLELLARLKNIRLIIGKDSLTNKPELFWSLKIFIIRYSKFKNLFKCLHSTWWFNYPLCKDFEALLVKWISF